MEVYLSTYLLAEHTEKYLGQLDLIYFYTNTSLLKYL